MDWIAFEATGVYARAVELALSHAGLPIIKVNPRQARRFAEGMGKLAKTDTIDAAMLARMVEALALDAKEPLPLNETLLQLKELLVARRALIRDLTAAKTAKKSPLCR